MKTKGILLTTIGTVLTLWMGWGLYVIYSTERPPYQIVQSLSSQVEIRQYEEQTWISTSYQTDDASFPVLASYIFGFRYTVDPDYPDNERPIDNVGLLPTFGFSIEW